MIRERRPRKTPQRQDPMIESPEAPSEADVSVPLGPPRPTRARTPRTVTMSRADCIRLMARNHVGRLAYTYRDAVDIVPIYYAYDDGWIYARTSPGQKIAKLRHNRWVAFEVDEIYGMFHWSSVVVHGGLYLLDADTTAAETWEQAVMALQKKFPGAFTQRDPVPFRSTIFRIHLDEVSGRRATPTTR